MNLLFFGSYEADRHPRVQVLIEGLRGLGEEVRECNVPVGLDTDARVGLLRRPWRAPLFAVRLGRVWLRLFREARRLPAPDAVIVGYMGHFDVHLARRIWPRTPIALDHMISAADTARDRRVGGRPLRALLERLDRSAVGAAELPFVDTEEHLEMLPPDARRRGVVVPVGASRDWFRPLRPSGSERLRVVFFGLFTPLQGTLTIARAMALLAHEPIDFLMFGRGQDYPAAREISAVNPNVTWTEGWVEPEELADRVAECDLCLGIFGTGPKGQRVVPNKVYQGAAAGCAIVTSGTAPQIRALGDAGVFVPAGDAEALAAELVRLAGDRERVRRLREAARSRALEAFAPEAVAVPLRDRLLRSTRPRIMT